MKYSEEYDIVEVCENDEGEAEIIALSEEEAAEQLEKGYEKAKRLLDDEDKVERFLQRLEKKLKKIPVAGEKLSEVPILISLVRSYIIKEYTDLPLGTIIAILSALIYLFSPIDLFIDGVPVLGYLDDVAVLAVCWKLVESDVVEYKKWREDNGKVLNV